MITFEDLVLKPSPNQYLVAPEGLCRNATPHRYSKLYDLAAPDLKRVFWTLLAKEPRIEYTEADNAGLRYELIQRSLVFRFPDLITIQFWTRGAETSTLAIYSRSKVGYSDFGVNKRRIDTWLDRLDTRIAER